MGIYTKASGVWYNTDLRVKSGGVWYNTDPYVKSGGVWKKLYPDIAASRPSEYITPAGGAGSQSFAGQSIGTAALNRLLVIAVTMKNSVAAPVITVDGVTATLIASHLYTGSTPDIFAGIYTIPKPTGTTATIGFTMSGTGFYGWGLWAVYTDNQVPADVYSEGGNAGGNTISGPITVTYSGGFILSVVCSHSESFAFTPVGCTEARDAATGGTSAGRHWEGYVSPAAAGTPTVGADQGSAVVKALATASWNRL